MNGFRKIREGIKLGRRSFIAMAMGKCLENFLVAGVNAMLHPT